MTRKSGKKRPSFQDQVNDCFDMVKVIMSEAFDRHGRDVTTAAATEILIALLTLQDKSARDTICAETCSRIEAGVKRLGSEVDIITSLEPEMMQ